MSTAQKFHLHVVYCEINPPTVGAMTGPRKLAAVNKAKGTDRWLCGQMSVIEPPELVTVGDPKNPEKKRKTISAATFGAKAEPIWNSTNRPRVNRKMLFRPLGTKLDLPRIFKGYMQISYRTSDSGANNSGPDANPRRKVVMPKVATV
jgi:hypothetical protein